MDTTSVWRATAPGTTYAALQGDVATDVLVIGGGITGVTTALLLAEQGRSVVLLEAERLGSGSTGNATVVQASGGGRATHLLIDCGLGIRQLDKRLVVEHAAPAEACRFFENVVGDLPLVAAIRFEAHLVGERHDRPPIRLRLARLRAYGAAADRRDRGNVPCGRLLRPQVSDGTGN